MLSNVICLKLSSNLLSLPCLGISVITLCFMLGVSSFLSVHSYIALDKISNIFPKEPIEIGNEPVRVRGFVQWQFRANSIHCSILKSDSQISLYRISTFGMAFKSVREYADE